MKYHLLVYDGKSYAETVESIENQEIRNIDLQVRYLKKGSETFKKGALYAYYTEIMQIPDGEIVILLKGGSTLAHPSVISEIDRLYREKNALMTYGGSVHTDEGKQDKEILLSDILNRKAREFPVRSMNLKTFYAALFKKIKLTDLLVEGFFPEEGFDYPLMLPMLEMAEERAIFSKEILHIAKGCNKSSLSIDLTALNPYSPIDVIM
ncbi:MAG: hypothetical protein SP4CHLAM5_04080 [Chlamydiia bacterium]|nr:hypothetical protein [Chlamydiia bacterium]MCH9618281.1 hypothetical protein [Chlamydiia bacterium]MCH9624154.1 hypothetical protein [Chlamydiia bacterium]